MDPISVSAIFSAIVAGATCALKPTTELVIQDAYKGFKSLLQRRWGNLHLEGVEAKPTSEAHKAALKEDLEGLQVQQDTDVVNAARELLATIGRKDPDVLMKIGVTLSDLDVGGNVIIKDVTGEDRGVDIHKSHIGADLQIMGVSQGAAPRSNVSGPSNTNWQMPASAPKLFSQPNAPDYEGKESNSDAYLSLKRVRAGRDIIFADKIITFDSSKNQSELAYNDHYLYSRGIGPYRDLLNNPEIDRLDDEPGEISINDLRELLHNSKTVVKPKLLNVRGVLFPAVLMSSGWWEREGKARINDLRWQDGLQEWLFNGFDLWGPSWDYIWNLDDNTSCAGHDYFLAQLGDGDEANSLPVVIPLQKAARLKELFQESWGGLEVRIRGMLGHRKQFSNQLENANFLGGLLDYCIWLDQDIKEHKITPLADSTGIYSGYLWKCVIPKKWIVEGKPPRLNKVYFLWEHTNFANREAVKYNLDSLLHKERYLEDQQGELVLIQKSCSLVPGEPAWPACDIYNLLAGKLAEGF